MLQKIFTNYYLVSLKGDLADNLPLYEGEEVWTPADSASIDSRIQIDDGFELNLPQKGNLYDLENSKLVYEAFRGLSRTQASDPRLWTYLTHVSCWEYMRNRWSPAEKFINDAPENRTAKLKTYILEHYFVRSDQSRALIRNGMARLWWYAFLTFDETRDNPYELTAVLLKNLDITKNLLERNLGRNKIILHSVLEFLLDKEDLINGGDAGRSRIRKLVQSLNLHGGHCILDSLSKSDIKGFLQKNYERIKNKTTEDDDQDIDEMFDNIMLSGE